MDQASDAVGMSLSGGARVFQHKDTDILVCFCPQIQHSVSICIPAECGGQTAAFRAAAEIGAE